MTRLRLGHSPDPDDAFMFCALAPAAAGGAAGAADPVDTEGLEFEHVLDDIQSLNERAGRGELEITALSLFAYSGLHPRYRLTTCGASVGDGYGPIIVANRAWPARAAGDGAGWRPGAETLIHVPGERTTAYLVLKLFAPLVRTASLPFDRILEAVADGEIENGLLIHEGQLTWQSHGVRKVADLGRWWADETGGLPLPLGVNAVRRDLDEGLMQKIQRVLRRSIEWGLAHRQEALAYARGFGRGIDEGTNDRFVQMYVNDFTLDLGPRGRAGVAALFERAAAQGLVEPRIPLDFIP